MEEHSTLDAVSSTKLATVFVNRYIASFDRIKI